MTTALTLWLAVAVVLTLLAGIGRLLGGRTMPAFTSVWVGWGAAATLMTLMAGATPLPMHQQLAAFGAVGLAGLTANPPTCDDLRRLGKLWLLALPLALVWGHTQVFMWDDFAHRLPSLAYTYMFDSLPAAGLPPSHSDFPAYPYALTLLGLAVCELLGGFAPTGIALVNGGLLVLFAGLVAHTLWPRHTLLWGRLAAALLLVTALAPPFIPKVLVSAYQDATLGLALAVAWLAWRRMLREDAYTWRDWLQLGVLLALVVSLKQVGLVLMTLFGLAIAALHALNLAPRKQAGLAPALLLFAPPVLVWSAWRSYVALNMPGGEFSLMPFADWNWPLIPTMLWSLAVTMWEKPLTFIPLLASTLLLAKPRWRARYVDAPTLAAIAVGWGYAGFLGFTYLAAFGTYEAGILASLTRYLQHVNWMLWLVLLVTAQRAGLFYRLHQRGWEIAAIALILTLPWTFKHQLIGKPNAEARQMLAVAPLLMERLPADGTILIQVDEPQGSGFRAKVLKYALGPHYRVQTGVTGFGVAGNPTPTVWLIADDDGLTLRDCRSEPCTVSVLTPEATEAEPPAP
ncbi:MAG: hypothetical protein H6922_01225 [Pseudomonadaceae bacterium]|nr:hypothetical protein [Pseudomonadaceae bacterium]